MTANPAVSVPAIPRLSILHLLLWTAFTAVALTCTASNPFRLPPGDAVARSVSLLLYTLLAMANGAAVTGMTILIPKLFSAANHRQLEPGHWILLTWGLIATVSMLWDGGMGFWLNLDKDNGVWSMGHLERAYGSVLRGITVPFLACAWWQGTSGKVWSTYFVLRTISAATIGIIGIGETATYILLCFDSSSMSEVFEMIVVPVVLGLGSLLELAAFVTLVVAAIVDRKSGNRRNWLHQVAVVLVITYPFLAAANWFGMQIFYSLTNRY